MKDDLPYFSHDNDAADHPKMMALRAQFGWEGYGRFWALNEAIARSSQARLDLSKKVNKATLAVKLGLSIVQLEAFLAFLSDPQECGLIHKQDDIVTTGQTQEGYAKVHAERERQRQRGKPVQSSFPEMEPDLHGTTVDKVKNTTEKTQNTTEKTRIVKETREEKSKSYSPEAFFEEFADSPKANPDVLFVDNVENFQADSEPRSEDFDPEPRSEDFTPTPSITIPHGLKFTESELAELTTKVGDKAGRHLERLAIIRQGKDYGFKNDWALLRYFWDKAGGPGAWLAGEKPLSGLSVQAAKPFKPGSTPEEMKTGVTISVSAKDFIQEARSAKGQQG